MQLRDHPLISYRGLPSWPPTWSLADAKKSDLKTLRGEIGRLKYILPGEAPDRFFLIIEHEGHRYVGCLLFTVRSFCTQMMAFIEKQAGLTIKEIGDQDLSRTL